MILTIGSDGNHFDVLRDLKGCLLRVQRKVGEKVRTVEVVDGKARDQICGSVRFVHCELA